MPQDPEGHAMTTLHPLSILLHSFQREEVVQYQSNVTFVTWKLSTTRHVSDSSTTSYVSYSKQIAWQHSSTLQKFSHIWFDHRAKFCRCFSYNVRACKGGFKKFGDDGSQRPWDWDDCWPPRNALLLRMFYHTKCRRCLGQIVWA